MKFSVIFGIVSICVFGSSQALELDDLRSDLKEATERLAAERESVAGDKVALSRELNALELELLEKRREKKLVELGIQGREAKVHELQKSAASFRKESSYLSGNLSDFGIEFGLYLRPGQATEEMDLCAAPKTGLYRRVCAVDSGIATVRSLMGGQIVKASVVGEQGELLEGQICNVGPASWFRDASGQQVGAVEILAGASHGRLTKVSNEKAVRALFDEGSGMLQLDVTGGKASVISKIQNDPLRLFEKGGVWLWPILLIAFLSTICGILKFVQLKKIIEPSGDWIGGLLEAVQRDDMEKAESLCNEVQHPVGAVVAKSLSFVSAGFNVVEEVIYEQMIGVQSQLQKWLPFIAVTAATAPLLGLLGTVSGMIRMFNVITVTGTSDVKPMAAGISEALVTTLFGLIVAIPALILHTILSRRSNGVTQTTERLGLSFVNGLKK